MAVRYHLNGLSEHDTKEYVIHRMKVAGATKAVFAEDAYHQIYLASHGVPRRINTICDLALLVGLSNNQDMIDKKTIVEVGDDMELADPHTGMAGVHPLMHPAGDTAAWLRV